MYGFFNTRTNRPRNGRDAVAFRLGTNFENGEHPQAMAPTGAWQAAESLGAWTLVGCTVAPGFEFAGFEMAPPDWRPTPRGYSRARRNWSTA